MSTVAEEREAKEHPSEESEAVSSDLKEGGGSGSNMEDGGEVSMESDKDREEAGQKEGRKRKRNKKNTGAMREVSTLADILYLISLLSHSLSPINVLIRT